jgi:acetaldehyde dehydrogenase (acetylating)
VGIAEKEASETVYWLEICEAAPLGEGPEVRALLKEAREITAIVTTIGRKAKGKSIRVVGVAVSLLMLSLVCFHFSLSRLPLFTFH